MAALFKLYVTHLFKGDKGTYGIENDFTRIEKNMNTMFTPFDISHFKKEAVKHPELINYTHQFCQFIVYFVLHQDAKSGQMTFFDCENDINTALDIYNKFTEGKWDKLHKDGFMKKFLDVQNEYERVKGVAQLTIEEI